MKIWKRLSTATFTVYTPLSYLDHGDRQAQEQTLECNFRLGQPRLVISHRSPATGGTTTDLFTLVVRVEYPEVGLRIRPSS